MRIGKATTEVYTVKNFCFGEKKMQKTITCKEGGIYGKH